MQNLMRIWSRPFVSVPGQAAASFSGKINQEQKGAYDKGRLDR
jgi:hypothetical protein